jgi:hypothetical protein
MMTYAQREFVSANSHRDAPMKSFPQQNNKRYYQAPNYQQSASVQLNHEEVAFCRTLSSWIAEDAAESLSLPSAQHYLRLIRDIMVLINPNSLRDNLLLSTVFYADRFVKRRGVKLEEPRKAFLVLLISALVTIKMWEDFEVKTETLERYTGISKKQISVLERQFLGVLEYSLFSSYEEMVSWQIECCFPQAPTA